MLLLDRQGTDRDLFVEIRSRWPSLPTAALDLRQLGVLPIEGSRVLRIEDAADIPLVLLDVLIDPLAEELSTDCFGEVLPYVDVYCRPGVTDAEGEMAARALSLCGAPPLRCHAGVRTRFAALVPPAVRPAVERLLGNPLIHRFVWSDRETRSISPDAPGSPSSTSIIPLRDAGAEQLQAISLRHHLALDGDEMAAVQIHFRELGRDPTDVELQSIALTWSEHCSHKTFKATIDFHCNGTDERIDGLLHTCIAAPTAELARPWVRSALAGNAGVIAFDDDHDLAFKVETHNHPSALEPYGGAHTGVGGVIRDVLAMSAEPLANTDVLCFGPPDLDPAELPAGAFHPARTYREVVRGVAAYGNNMGIPTVGGAVLFHHGYTTNPLVFCGTLGIAPRTAYGSEETGLPAEPLEGDVVVVLGGRTGRDGLHGATMSSETLDRQTAAASAVQIGAPITEKVLRDVLPLLRDEGLYRAITDCGAGGLCSAVGEMAQELGVDVDLSAVPTKYEGLAPWEIWLSEAQERMVLAAQEESLPRLLEICSAYDLEASVIGRFRGDGRLRIHHHGQTVGDIGMAFLHGGRPQRTLKARWTARPSETDMAGNEVDAQAALLALLAHPTIASKEDVIRRYDHEVGGATVVKPLVGNSGPSDAAVLQPLPHSQRGVVLAHGINPLHGALDPYQMAMGAVDEALRNLVAVGGSIDHVALLDNFCWGDVDDEEELGRLVRAAQGCRDAALAYGAPFICGKDSLRNTSLDREGVSHSIPGTLLISAVGVVDDVRRTVTMDLKGPNNRLYLLGTMRGELGGSHYLALKGVEGGAVPSARPEESRATMLALSQAIRDGLVLSCHDLSEGGLAVAAAEMSLAGGVGVEIDLDAVPAERDALEALLFAESTGRFLVEVAETDAPRFEEMIASTRAASMAMVGRTTREERFAARHHGSTVIDLPVTQIERAWKGIPSATPTGDNTPIEAPVPACSTPHIGLRRAQPRALVLTAAGVNCDRETMEACRLAGADVEAVHVNRLLHGSAGHLLDYGMLVLAGGFSYGDHLGAGTMLAAVLRHGLLDTLETFIAAGRPVLGICNGFQVLARLGLLGPISLVPNSDGRFHCEWTELHVQPSPCIFLRGFERMELPIAHGEGRVVMPPECVDLVLPFAPLRYRRNPNGSMAGIAGVCNAGGNVFGLMPHPERYLTPLHHPLRSGAPPAGVPFFGNAIRYIQEEL